MGTWPVAREGDVLMKVLHVITGLNTGGAEMMLYKLLSHIDSSKHEARVLSLIEGGAMRERIQSTGIPVDSLNMRRGIPSFSGLRRLREIVRRYRPDLIQGWMYHGNLTASVAAWFCHDNPPVVWNVRQSLYDLDHERSLTRWVIRANARLSARTHAIIYNSRTSAHQHEAFGFDANRTRIIANGFDTEVFRPDERARAGIRRELSVTDDSILIGLIGRYDPMKDHRNFLDAAALLGKDFPNVRFLLAGGAVAAGNSELGAMIEALGLGGRVFLLGERNDIPQLTGALDIATSSSWGEGFANVVGEAMSCGVPCVVTDVGDSAWIINDTGRVVPPRESESLATAWKALIALGRDGRQALGWRARQRVIDYFSLGAVVQQYEDLYECLIARAKG
jgi:glycosyltransferase involved in cell wall biosynthesis